MSEQPSVPETTASRNELQVNIISPSVQIQKLTFPGLSTSCTIKELKEKIRDASPLKIGTDKQKLIYRGHVIQAEHRTLGELFGQDAVDNNNEPFTIHLIIPPTTGSQHAASASAPSAHSPRISVPQPVRANANANIQIGPSAALPNAGRSNTDTPSPRPQTVPTPQMPGNAHQGQVPNHIQQTMAQLHAINQHMAAHLMSMQAGAQNIPHPHAVQPTPNAGQPPHSQIRINLPHNQANVNPAPRHPTPSLQHGLPNPAMHLRAEAGQHRSSSAPPRHTNTNTVIREQIGPNGERWRSTYRSESVAGHAEPLTPSAVSTLAESGGAAMPRSSSTPGSRANAAHPSPLHAASPSAQTLHSIHNHQPNAQVNTQLQQTSLAIQTIQTQMNIIESWINVGALPPNHLCDSVSNLIQSLAVVIPQEHCRALLFRHAGLMNRVANIRRDTDTQVRRFADQTAVNQRAQQDTAPTTMYLLSSPTGPQALLLSPSGNFTTPLPIHTALQPQYGYLPNLNGNVAQHFHGLPPSAAGAQIQPGTANQPAQQNPHVNGQNEPGIAQILQIQQQQQARRANQPRDIMRVIIPLGSHLWLLIRLFGFVYFFTHGASWRRTILLSIAALLLFIAQTGAFRPFAQRVWDPIRRHAEALLPLAGEEPARGENAGQRGHENPTDSATVNRGPSPQEAADRLLREREQQDTNLLRQGLRRIERAVALFIASLVPGVGERHIAAREAAEAARLAEEREQEERRRREEEEREQASTNELNSSAAEESTQHGAESGSGTSAAPESAAQPPLIEV